MDTYVGEIIDAVRHDTRNEDEGSHSDKHILRYIQHAQDKLFSEITNSSYNYVFEHEIDIDIVADQAEYTIDDNLSYGTRISGVLYSYDGDANHFKQLEVTPYRPDRLTYSGRPAVYRRRNGSIILEPIPNQSTGKLRVTYERALDKLALRTAKIKSMASTKDLELEWVTDVTQTEDEAELVLNANAYFCVSDFYGTVYLYNGRISSYTANTNSILSVVDDLNNNLVTGYTLNDMIDNGTYITIGKYSTTHSEFPNEVLPFFIEFANRKLHSVDASEQFDDTSSILSETLDVIVNSYKLPDKDVKPFPVKDFSLLIPGYD